MTAPTETTIPGAVEPVDGPTDPPEGKDTGEPQKANREARYRVERNEAREALTAAQARIERMQRSEIERLAASALSHPADLFSLSGNGLADYLTEDGDVDPERVAADVAAVLAERPGLRKPSGAFDPSQGHGGTVRAKPEPSWSGLLKP
jgi:hypothetical protein